jgi:nucleoid-associated protein YgaU
VTRTRVRRRRLVLTVLIAAGIGAFTGQLGEGAAAGLEMEPVSRNSVVVHDGDTLWSIAERLAPGEDPRPLVDAISVANGVGAGSLMPGQTLVIPGSD